MYLYINTCENDGVTLGLFSDDMNKIVKVFFKKTLNKNNVLACIEKFLKKQKIKPADLAGILCVKGPGKFSSVRAGVSAANTMSWLLGISNSELLNNDLPEDEKMLWNFLKNKIESKNIRHIIEPFYGQEPNITVKKKQ